MEINEFAQMNWDRAKRNDKGFDLLYWCIATAGESGEIMNLMKKVIRGDHPLNEDELAEEAADVITYAFLLLKQLKKDPEKVLMKKFEKVNERLASGGFHIRN